MGGWVGGPDAIDFTVDLVWRLVLALLFLPRNSHSDDK